VRREEANWSYNFGDPYYLDSAYGTGYDPNNGMYYPDWSCPGGYGPGMGCGPGMGHGPGWGPGMGYDPSHQWGGNCYMPGYPGGDAPWDELLQLARDTNQCCRRMMEMMQSMHNNHHGNMMSEE
jgi:hypothetical protein